MSGVLIQKPPSSQTGRLTNEAKVTGFSSQGEVSLPRRFSLFFASNPRGDGQAALVNVAITTAEIAP